MKAWIESHGRGPVEIEPGSRGQFDVVADGRVVYSRYQTGRFPSDADLERMRL